MHVGERPRGSLTGGRSLTGERGGGGGGDGDGDSVVVMVVSVVFLSFNTEFCLLCQVAAVLPLSLILSLKTLVHDYLDNMMPLSSLEAISIASAISAYSSSLMQYLKKVRYFIWLL